MRSAVFLDRDGVINPYVYNPDFGTVDSPSTPDQFQLIPQVTEAIGRLHSLGFLLIVVSNQPGIAKGKFTRALLQATTAKMLVACNQNIDDVYYCLHHPFAEDPQYASECSCRKPKPGMLFEASAKWKIDLESSYMIGDGFTDILAGKAARTKTILIGARKCYLCEEALRQSALPDFFALNLGAAAEIIHQHQHVRLRREGAQGYEFHSGLC